MNFLIGTQNKAIIARKKDSMKPIMVAIVPAPNIGPMYRSIITVINLDLKYRV
jgi:hypothetical protein